MKTCPQCNHPVGDDDPFCMECGRRLSDPVSIHCPKCNAVLDLGSSFCDHCGTGLQKQSEPALAVEAMTGKIGTLNEICTDWNNGLPVAQVARRLLHFTDAEPDNFRAWELLGITRLKLGEYAAAEAAYQRALQINPKALETLMGLGHTARFTRNYGIALDYYLRVTEADESNASAYSCMAMVFLAQYEDTKAREFAEVAYKIDPEDSNIVSNYAIVCHYQQDHPLRDKLYRDCKRLGHKQMQTLDAVLTGELQLRDEACHPPNRG